MFLSSHTRRRLRISLSIGVAYVLVIGAVAWFKQSAGEPFLKGFLSWFVGVPIAFAAYAALEWAAEKLLGLSFWNQLPPVGRVLLLVATIILFVVASLMIVRGLTHGQPAL